MPLSVPKFAKSWRVMKFDEDKAGGVREYIDYDGEVRLI